MRVLFFVIALFAAPAFAGPGHQAKLPSEFDAQVTHVVDGDTFRFKASLLNIDINDTCRMSEYNAPEVHGAEKPEGVKAKARMISLIGGKTVHIVTRGKEKYGRWLCTASTGTISIGCVMREYLMDYSGRDKYLRRTKTAGTGTVSKDKE